MVYLVKQTAIPVIHEFGAYIKVDDLNLYKSVVSYFSNLSRHEQREHRITLGNKRFKFWSKQGGLINPETEQRAFEYALHWQSAEGTKEGASKCYMLIKPMFGKGTKTINGKTINYPDIGTQIEVETSYYTIEEIQDLVEELLTKLDCERFIDSINMQKSTIKEIAYHVRYHEQHEPDVINVLKALKEQSSTVGDYNSTEKKKRGLFDMYMVSNPALNEFGIHNDFNANVKSYRITDFLDRDLSDPLRHPKLEVFLNPKEYRRANEELPKLTDYHKIKKDYYYILASLLNCVDDSIKYVPDSYFSGKKYNIRYELPEIDIKQMLNENPELELPDNNQALRLLSYVTFSRSGFCAISDMIEHTGIPERTAYRYLNQYIQAGILDKIRADKSYIFFKKKSHMDSIKDGLSKLSRYLNFGYKTLWGYIFKKSDEIKPYHQRHTNYKPLEDKSNKLIPVATDKDKKRIQDELERLGIRNKRIFVSANPT